MEDDTDLKSSRGKGMDFCCFSYPLIKFGAYLIPFEFGFVSGCIIVLTTTTPTIVAAVDTLPRVFPFILLVLASITMVWQLVGLLTVRIEMSSIYRFYIRINFLLTLITALVGAIGTIIVASKHGKSVDVCTRIYGNPPLNSGTGVMVQGLDQFKPGRYICGYFMWAQAAAMGGLVVMLFLTQSYFCFCQRTYGQKQRSALQQLESFHQET